MIYKMEGWNLSFEVFLRLGSSNKGTTTWLLLPSAGPDDARAFENLVFNGTVRHLSRDRNEDKTEIQHYHWLLSSSAWTLSGSGTLFLCRT
jgi:hypothetical protein